MHKVDKNIRINPKNFFSKDLVKNFTNHINNSVPKYSNFCDGITSFSEYFITDNSVVYDLGCSHASLLIDIVKKNKFKNNVNYYGLDSSQDMFLKAKQKTKKYKNIFIKKQNILTNKFKKSDLIISNLTTQFIKFSERRKLIKKIYNALNEKGAFIMVEKTNFKLPLIQSIANDVHFDFKRENNISGEEILAKIRSMRGKLDPYDSGENIQILKDNGFKKVEILFKELHFEMVIAVK